MRDGECWEQTMPAHLIAESESGLWPTPTVACADGGQKCRGDKRKNELLLSGAVRMFPTPTANEDAAGRPGAKMQRMLGNHPDIRNWSTPTARDANSLKKVMRGKWSKEAGQEIIEPLPVQVGGTLNPTWVEWLMGWPLGWTSLDHLGTDRFQQWLRLHGGY